ncbi:putative dehydrogenase [Roseimicrobium gellanilyticum]|uniref:Putative dehydrogenase n=1 Tax=Roseimicrobium gellanilyticum TaxID=748857 RepID=A0A366H7D4_9BACT|nr:Gfo/Idh/MocA family oxidoreductase [Roseimicrobium gellanilyticum]RBP38081.1 putative dehydrogenase [Roseimicrobium gellanilyticum]
MPRTTTSEYTRRRLIKRTLLASAGLSARMWAETQNANSDVRIAVIGFNSKGAGHIQSLLKIKGVRIVALCDVDSAVMDKQVALLKGRNIEVKKYSDYRKLVEDPEIDAVTIATPNHTHTVIALAALAAGKHVYVEKPVCHNLHEGAMLVEAGKKVSGKLILQHGMQRRSDPGWNAAEAYLKTGAIGKTVLSRAMNFRARQSIGTVAGPVSPPATVDYNLWCGPREMAPVMREQFHYDWHWQWAYGNGDIGNNGPHQLDVARRALGNPVELPLRVISFGRRWGYTDNGQTPNNQFALFDYGKDVAPLLFDNRGLPRADMNWQKGWEPDYKGVRIGNVYHCEGGYIAESKAYDLDGKWNGVKFPLNDGSEHMSNFIASIRSGKQIHDNLDISHGFQAAALAHMANISYRIGREASVDVVRERVSGNALALETVGNFVTNLAANKIDLTAAPPVLGPFLEFNPRTLKFEGEFAVEANAIAESDTYRKGFELSMVS